MHMYLHGCSLFIAYACIYAGFSTGDCENEVMIGDYMCTPTTTPTKTKIVCSMSEDDAPDIGITYPVSVSQLVLGH